MNSFLKKKVNCPSKFKLQCHQHYRIMFSPINVKVFLLVFPWRCGILFEFFSLAYTGFLQSVPVQQWFRLLLLLFFFNFNSSILTLLKKFSMDIIKGNYLWKSWSCGNYYSKSYITPPSNPKFVAWADELAPFPW